MYQHRYFTRYELMGVYGFNMAKEKNHKGKQSHNRKTKIFRNWGVDNWKEIREKLNETKSDKDGDEPKSK